MRQLRMRTAKLSTLSSESAVSIYATWLFWVHRKLWGLLACSRSSYLYVSAGPRKGGGPRRGGGRGPRTGPALGGEAGSVLSESLSALGSRIDYGIPHTASANG